MSVNKSNRNKMTADNDNDNLHNDCIQNEYKKT